MLLSSAAFLSSSVALIRSAATEVIRLALFRLRFPLPQAREFHSRVSASSGSLVAPAARAKISPREMFSPRRVSCSWALVSLSVHHRRLTVTV